MPDTDEFPSVSPETLGNMPVAPRWPGLAKLVLGSKSWSRRTLLSELGVPPFSLAVPEIDEKAIRHTDAEKLVLAIGRAKAVALLARNEVVPAPATAGKTLLVCGDSVIRHKDRILEKPVDMEEARAFLRSYGTAPACTVSSIIVVDVAARRMWEGVDEAEVYFHKMPEDVIEQLVKSEGAMDSAGALRIEHPLSAKYTDYILGDYSAVMGFSKPLAELLMDQALAGEGGDLLP